MNCARNVEHRFVQPRPTNNVKHKSTGGQRPARKPGYKLGFVTGAETACNGVSTFKKAPEGNTKTYLIPFLLQLHKLTCLLTQPKPLPKATASKQLVQRTSRIFRQSVLVTFQSRNAHLALRSGFIMPTLASLSLCDSSGVERPE